MLAELLVLLWNLVVVIAVLIDFVGHVLVLASVAIRLLVVLGGVVGLRNGLIKLLWVRRRLVHIRFCDAALTVAAVLGRRPVILMLLAVGALTERTSGQRLLSSNIDAFTELRIVALLHWATLKRRGINLNYRLDALRALSMLATLHINRLFKVNQLWIAKVARHTHLAVIVANRRMVNLVTRHSLIHHFVDSYQLCELCFLVVRWASAFLERCLEFAWLLVGAASACGRFGWWGFRRGRSRRGWLIFVFTCGWLLFIRILLLVWALRR